VECAQAGEFVERRAFVFRNMMEAFSRSRSGRLLVVGSHELAPHPDPTLSDFVGRHRYLVLLVALLERTIAMVGKEGRSCTVKLWAGDRWLLANTPSDGPWSGGPLEQGSG
jgi:hypothetical protein